MSLDYNVHVMHLVCEDIELSSTLGYNVCIDDKLRVLDRMAVEHPERPHQHAETELQTGKIKKSIAAITPKGHETKVRSRSAAVFAFIVPATAHR